MTTDQKTKLAAVEAMLQRTVELGEKATDTPWEVSRGIYHHILIRDSKEQKIVLADAIPEDASFIAHSCNQSPAMARALLVALESLDKMINFIGAGNWCNSDGRGCPAFSDAEDALIEILNQFDL